MLYDFRPPRPAAQNIGVPLPILEGQTEEPEYGIGFRYPQRTFATAFRWSGAADINAFSIERLGPVVLAAQNTAERAHGWMAPGGKVGIRLDVGI